LDVGFSIKAAWDDTWECAWG